jgi:hypothetical protein
MMYLPVQVHTKSSQRTEYLLRLSLLVANLAEMQPCVAAVANIRCKYLPFAFVANIAEHN